MGEFGWEHTDFSISFWPALVAAGVGVDILDADDPKPVVFDFDELAFFGIFARKAVVEGSGGGKNGAISHNHPYAFVVASEDFFKFHGFAAS